MAAAAEEVVGFCAHKAGRDVGVLVWVVWMGWDELGWAGLVVVLM